MKDKVIVTNNSALKRKYGTAGVARINSALKKLIAADAKRGISTVVVALDDAATMAGLVGLAVQRVTDEKANKAAIDAVSVALKPDYLMILGSVDVVPHQQLTNPAYTPPNDKDKTVPSDLPYACTAPYSKRIGDFVAPSRVVSRLPDLTNARTPEYMLKLIDFAVNPAVTPVAAVRPFGLSTQSWQVSTNLSLRTLFATANAANTSPVNGPNWTQAQLRGRFHFINCHGAQRTPQFFGEPNNYPIAHDAVWLSKRTRPGTVVAAECCYGAELYDPVRSKGQMCIGQTYLSDGAAAYLGSTTIAYGPATTNNYADVICRLFLEEVLNGRSSGDAMLSARLRYVQSAVPIDAIDLKTSGSSSCWEIPRSIR